MQRFRPHTRRPRAEWLLAFALAFASTSCTLFFDTGPGNPPLDFARADGGRDATGDAGEDAEGDAAPDAAEDPGEDRAEDPGQDAAEDPGQDTVTDDVADDVADVPVDTGGLTVSEVIALARSQEDGPLDLEIDGAVVTYVRPAVATAPAGFFIQGERTGPGLHIEVDPSTLDPVPQPGDVVRLGIVEMDTIFGVRLGLLGDTPDYERLSTGTDLDTLIQDVTDDATLVTALDDFESEYITIDATLAGDFAFAGTGHLSAPIDSGSVLGDPDGAGGNDPVLVLRIHDDSDGDPPSLLDALVDTYDFETGCDFTLVGPVWRFFEQAQPSAYFLEDIDVTSCGDVVVESASATGANQVRVTFNRRIKESSLTVGAFSIEDENSNSIVITGAALSTTNDARVILTTQEPVTDPDIDYTVTVASSVFDLLDTGVLATSNTATFPGWDLSTPAASVAIGQAYDAADGPVDIEVDGAIVTYVRPTVATSPAGFWVQAEQTGPGLLIEHDDPGALGVAVGQTVRFTIVEMDTVFGARVGLLVPSGGGTVDFEVLDSGFDVSTLLQEVTEETTLVSALDDFISEYITLEGTVDGAFGGAGTGHSSAYIDTTVLTGSVEDLRLRVPSDAATVDLLGTLQDDFEFGDGCEFILSGPMWRFNDQAQPSAYFLDDIEVTTCGEVVVTEAEATGENEVTVSFNRRIDGSSVTAGAFAIEDENTTTVNLGGAALSGTDDTEVILTTTETVTDDSITYTVTVAASVTDLVGTGVKQTDGDNQADFSGLPEGLAITGVDYQVIAHGGQLIIAGSGFTGATSVTIGGTGQTFNVDSDVQVTIADLDPSTPLGTQTLTLTTPGGSDDTTVTVIHLMINELDADQDSTDSAEFVEIATSLPGTNVDLSDIDGDGNGYVVVFYNGSDDLSYDAYDLIATDTGLLTVGNPASVIGPNVPGAVATNLIQNGADAVAIMQGVATDFPNDTALPSVGGTPSASNLIDALVYDTSDGDDAGLLDPLLGTSGDQRVQINEDGNGNSVGESIQRCGDDALLDGRVFTLGTPSPGAGNTCS